ncbi:basic proline-rich protein-like [Theropithecus gelada]|uniref:basic proline-rich protein-like n=1 Tax=Theropithecus gelada TaxID=9565 RepID=UPI000DC1738D|nr:basic proline-rich protein-like [Theropithecus gelada]
MPSLPDNILARVRPPRRPRGSAVPGGRPWVRGPGFPEARLSSKQAGLQKTHRREGGGQKVGSGGAVAHPEAEDNALWNVAGALRRRLFPQAPAEGPAESLAGRPRGPQPCSGPEREPMQPGSIPCPSPVPGAPPASEPSTWPQGRRDHPPPIPTAPPCLPFPGPVSSPPLPPPLSGRRFGGPDRVLAGN